MSVTVYGHIHPSATPGDTVEIDFDLSALACLVQDAHIEWTGAHAGMVALTLTEATNEDCNDTFYGCVNWATGKFQVVIPDSCCISEYVEEECPCYELGQTPLYYTIEISGVNPCPGQDCSGVNGIHKVTFDHADEDGCRWINSEDNLYFDIEYYETPPYLIRIDMKCFYFYDIAESCSDIESGSANNRLEEDCGGITEGYGGIAKWCKFWNPTGCP